MNRIFILFFALFLTSEVKAQIKQPCSTCLPEGIEFLTQAQIDSFQVNYPNCTEIEGDVSISGGDITNLNGLNVLNYIWGYLEIYENDALTSLTGLEGLNSIGDYLYIIDNPALTSLTGLEGLTSVGGYSDVSFNNALTSLTGLDNLTSIGFSLNLYGNNALTSMTGLEGLMFIGGSFNIIDNTALTSLTGLEGLTSVGYNLNIYGNLALISLSGLEGLTFIGDYLDIGYNASLTSLTGLEGLTSVGGYLGIGSNASLSSLMGLEGLMSIGGSLGIGSNAFLTSLTGIEGLMSIGGSLNIFDNAALTSLTGLENVEANAILDLYIYGNPSLSTCAVKSICDYLASPNGTIEIHDNATGCNSQEEVDSACVYLSNGVVNFQPVFAISPNPTSNQITISTPTTPYKNTFMTIFNINGQQLIKRQITQEKTMVDVEGLSQGVYFVRITNDRTVQVGKFVKR